GYLSKLLDSYLKAPTVEERAYAFAKLDRSRGRAAPYLLKRLKDSIDKDEHPRVLELMTKLGPDVLPRLVEALNPRDAKDARRNEDLRLSLLELIRRRNEKRAVPYLWNLSASKKVPEIVRSRAAATLASLLGTDPKSLPPAKVVLTQMAEKLYEHRVKFLDPRRVEVWLWEEDYTIAPDPIKLTAPVYEQIFGLPYARQALHLDPAYRPAQLVYLQLMLHQVYQPLDLEKDKLDEFLLGKTNASVDELLASLDADLVLQTLDRGLAEH